ncbi:SDR family NAD(P)-dependent oxidoreductase [Streptomyces palmae]|uniref:Alpha/beta fold hydrolase n=1 Tax=Streptomyces palmae TaxID=1701085 RepID=A0A4Z0HAU0_9ACTN|nr:SDR family NAD(P)-dependent oxidoreductase [Streptomyces palmae]TGB12294.1 alpha/beta fold hydrolase [Streptomyces palmae]
MTGLPEEADPFAAGLPLRPVGVRGRISPNGRLAAGDAAGDGAVLGGQWVDPAGVERALLELDQVRDCRVVARRRTDGALALVAYVVPCDAVGLERLTDAAQQALPAGAPRLNVVPLSVLPRTATGAVDLTALRRLPVPDEESAAVWERRLVAEGAVEAVAVPAKNPPPAAGRIRLGVRGPGTGAGRAPSVRRPCTPPDGDPPKPYPDTPPDGDPREPYPDTVPNWFHRPVWQPAEAPRTLPAARDRACTVVLADPGGVLASRVAALVRAAGGRCAVLPAGVAGQEVVNRADRVLDLGLFGSPDRGPEPLDALVSLLRGQAAVRAGAGRPLVLDVVAAESRAGLGGAPDPGRAAAVAVLKSAVRELPWLSGRWIDADPADDPEGIARLLRAEGCGPVTDLDIAYRGGVRRVLRWERLPPPTAESALRPGGHYLITGGPGGPAARTARYLLEVYRASVTLVGRVCPAEAPDRVAAVLDRLRPLGEVRYLTADVTDRVAVHRVLRTARAQHRALDGVLHLAGVVEERPLLQADAGHWERVLAAKTVGAEHLLDALADQRDVLFVAHSALHGTFGGRHAAAHAAACARLDALTVRRWAAGMRVQSLAWSGWDAPATGAERSGPPRGHAPLSAREAVCSLDLALRHPEPHLLVGLDPRTPWVGGLTTGPARPLHRLTAHLVPGPRWSGGRAADPPADAFGTPIPGVRVHHTSLPRTADGAPDRALLAGRAPADAPVESAEPPTGATERALAELWCALLDVGRIGRHEDFFALGGTSSLAVRLADRIRTVLGREIQAADLRARPTIAALAAHLDQGAGAELFAFHLPLRPAGSGAPLFCVHPGGGTAWPYAPLLRYLDPHIPVHGIQARGLSTPAHMPAAIEDFADDYAREIRALRPHGPYALLGWSMGGFVAHAVATRLQRAGEHIALLAILDSYPFRDADVATLPAAHELEGQLLGLLLDGAGVARARDADPPDRSTAVAALRGSGSVLGEMDEAGLGRMVEVMRHNTRLLIGHTPGVVDGDLLLVTADRSYPVDAPPPAERWRPHVSGRVIQRHLDCTHQEMLRPEHLPHLASALNAALAPTKGLRHRDGTPQP